ncbi:LysR family transcriptional regulator [Planosporangium flavigriseum]|uniref:LysR family transcriptional regulator n=1 Tax=Planosporangium flavigriseum TaxID=373681 RepID=A0A8J3LLN5_9ACTN|nr:LysR family transcriptional regulator [Planosporangium flavigriseum]NJC65750.1 LysR family transcriptional regulator [Planosporangium flavigriseum]GIG73604.1 LysR family transcriptional regulator [Planosporangium flavigriseum]
MELSQLRYFLAVADELHFGRAAEHLRIAQPGLSQQIRRLERELGTPLFIRTTRRVELTDAGRAMQSEARRVLASVERARTSVTQAANGEAGVLRLAFVSSAALQIIPNVTKALHQRWPGIDLQLHEMTTPAQFDDLREGRLDVGIVREAGVVDDLVIRPLVRERLYLAVHESHRLAGQRSVTLASLAGERFIIFPRHRVSLLYDHIAGLCHAAGFRLEPAEEAVQFPTILGLVASDAGVAIVPDSLRSLRLPSLRYLALEDAAANTEVSIAYSPERALSRTVQNFVEVALSVYRNDTGAAAAG